MIDKKKIIGAGGGGGKGGGGGGRTPKNDPDSLDSRSHASVLDLIGEGELEGLKTPNPNFVSPISGASNPWHQSIILNNTPLQNRDGSYNFKDVTVHARPGTASQAIMPGFEETSSETPVNVVVRKDNPVEVTITNTSVDAVRIAISVGVLQRMKSNGDAVGTEFDFYFQKKQGNGAWSNIDVGTDHDSGAHMIRIKGRTADLYQRQWEFDIQNNTFPVMFRAVRETVDDGDIDLNASKLLSINTEFRVASYAQVTFAGAAKTGTYTQSDEAGGSGNVIEITYNDGHELLVGDAVNIDFTSGSSVDKNFVVSSITTGTSGTDWKSTKFKVTASDSRNTSGNVSFRKRYTYPNSAVVGLTLDAEQFNNIPTRAYRVRGIKVRIPGTNGGKTPTVDQTNGRIIYPSGYIFNGTMGAAQWTTDPAFCLYDLLTSSRYGCGDHISDSQLDKYSFYSISRYCSELVTFKTRLSDGSISTNTEPRFSLNCNIQKREDVFKVINNLCSVFRGMPYYSAGALTLTQDKKGVDSSHLFTLANVTEEGFTYSGTAQKTRTTVAIVKYYDLELRDAVYEEVVDEENLAKHGLVSKTINAFGCTSRYQARRIGKWLLYVANNETQTCVFTTSLEAGTLCRPGQIIDIADPVKAGVRRGGRIKEVPAANKIKVDNTDLTDLPGAGSNVSYTRKLFVVMKDGSVCEGNVDVSPAGITSDGVITTDTNFRIRVNDASGRQPGQPDYQDTFQDQTPSVNSLWILETIGTDAQTIQTSKWKVIGVEEKSDFQYTVTALSHNESKYDHIEKEEPLDYRDSSNLNELPAAPTRWSIREIHTFDPATSNDPDDIVSTVSTQFPIQQLYRYRDEVRVKVIAAWKPVLGVNEYLFKWRVDSGGWNTVRQQNPDYEILDVAVDSTVGSAIFDFEVYSVNAAGRPSVSPLTSSFTCTGKTAKPSDVTTFTLDFDPHVGFQLKWLKIVPTAPEFADLDIRGYELREGTSWSTAALIGEFNTTSHVVGSISAGASVNYLIKAVDTDGNYSVNAKSVTGVIVDPAAPGGGTYSYQNDSVVLSWNAPSINSGDFTYAIDEYEIYQGSISSSNLKGTTKALNFTIPVTWNSDQIFKIRAKDLAGNYGNVLDITVLFAKAPAPNIEWVYEGQTLRLSWNNVSGNTETREYEIRQSGNSETNVDNATIKQTIKANTYVLDVDWVTTTRFWVRAIDINGNFGETGRTGITNYPDVSFSLPPTPTVTHNSFDGKNENVVLNWDSITKPSDGLPISEYKIYRTASSVTEEATATTNTNFVGKSDATFYSEKVTWNTGSQKYWVSAVDVNGNEGTADAENVTIQQIPQPANVTQEVVDNNVLLRWEEPSLTGCLPVSFYNLYRTNTQPSNLIGSKQGKFTTVFEQAGGTYDYFLAAVDSSGREGIAASRQAIVNEPPDYVLNADLKSALIDGTITATYSQSNDTNTGAGLIVTVTKLEHGLSVNQQIEVDFTSGTANSSTDDGKKYVIKSTTTNEFTFQVAGSRQTTGNISYNSPSTLSNAYVSDGFVYFCLDTSTQYQNHFAGTGFDSNGANVAYALPSENSGSYEEIFDYGGVLATSSIAVNMAIDTDATVGEGVTITPRIYVSANGTSWTDKGAGNGTVLANDFRYIKTRFDLSAVGNNDLIKVTEISTKLSVKQKTDQGSGTLASGQAQSVYDAGVQISFAKTFVDIDSISLSLRGSTGDARYAIYDFVDAFAPNGFKVYLYKADGTKTHGTFDWTARGV